MVCRTVFEDRYVRGRVFYFRRDQPPSEVFKLSGPPNKMIRSIAQTQLRLFPSQFTRCFSKNTHNDESISSLQHEMSRLIDHAESNQHVTAAVDAPLDVDGVALQTKGQLVTIGGLADARAGTVATFESGASAFIFELRASEVNAAIIGNNAQIENGERVVNYSTDSVSFPVGPGVLGRVLNGIGEPIDDKGPLTGGIERQRSLVARVPGIASRGATTDPFVTGIKKVDLMSPIGKGQRVAFVGVPGTGKTTTALNILIHHAKSDINAHSVYAAVGTAHSFHAVVQLLEKEGVHEQFTVVWADRRDSEAAKYLAPYGACAVAEWFQKNGHHAAVVYDDLVGHANSLVNLGQLSNMALSDRTRYLHSNLLERAAQMNRGTKHGGGSMTAIALVDTPHTDREHATQFAADEAYMLGQRTGTTVSSIVDITLQFDSKLASTKKWPAVDMSQISQLPTLACQPKPLTELSRGLYHMQVAARETIRQVEVMGEFGLDVYDEGRIEEGRRMKYWTKMEELLLTGQQHEGDEDDVPKIGGRQPFSSMQRACSSELYVTLVAGACGKLTLVPLQYVRQYERELWLRAWEEEEGEMMNELERAMNAKETLDSVIAERVKKFVHFFTSEFVKSLGLHAVGEHLTVAEMSGGSK